MTAEAAVAVTPVIVGTTDVSFKRKRQYFCACQSWYDRRIASPAMSRISWLEAPPMMRAT